jgi:hypothetical protein
MYYHPNTNTNCRSPLSEYACGNYWFAGGRHETTGQQGDPAQVRAIAATVNVRLNAKRKALLFRGANAAAAAKAMAKALRRDLYPKAALYSLRGLNRTNWGP